MIVITQKDNERDIDRKGIKEKLIENINIKYTAPNINLKESLGPNFIEKPFGSSLGSHSLSVPSINVLEPNQPNQRNQNQFLF